MGLYSASTILGVDTVGLQDMGITHYDSMFGVIKDVSDVLWDSGLCLLQVICAFVVESITRLVTASLYLSIF